MGKNVKKIFVAGMIAVILEFFFIIPALAFDTQFGDHNYKWSAPYIKCVDSDNFSNRLDEISVTPIFKITDHRNESHFNFFLSSYSTYFLKLNATETLSDTDDDSNLSFLNINAYTKTSGISLWVSGLYGNSELCRRNSNGNDTSTYLIAAGADTEFGAAKVHGHFFYAAGNDSVNYNDDVSAFSSPLRSIWIGQPYYSAEIMGYGKMDNLASYSASPFDRISSIAAINLGASIKPMDKLTLKGDIWYAKLADKDSTNNSSLGSEIDLVVTYELIEDLKFDIIGAYLFSGDSTSTKLVPGRQLKNDNSSYPYELGARLSLSF